MTKTFGRFAVLSLLFVAACGGSSGGGSSATITITAPQSGVSVALGTDAQQSVPVSFTLTNLSLMQPGLCAGATKCGHIHLVIDSYTSPCNTASGVGSEKYNGQITSGTSGNALFASCGSGAVGTHSITLELHDDAHNDLTDSNGNLIKTTATNITTHT